MAGISPSTYSGPYTANGSQTAFPFDFTAGSSDEVLVDVGGATVSSSLYTVALDSDFNGGTVTFLTAPVNAAVVTLYPDPDFLQASEFENEGAYKLSTVNTINRRSAVRDLWLRTRLVLFSPSGIASSSNRIGKFFGWDAIGDPTFLSGTGADSALRTDLVANTGASLIRWVSTAAGAVARTVLGKLNDHISVKDFGAIGDGTTDDTAAFQAAIDVATSFGNTYTSIYIPPGLYRITDTVRINKNKVRLFGAGDKSCLYFQPTADNKVMLLVQNSNAAALISYVSLENFGFIAHFSAPVTGYLKTGIKLIDASTVTINNVNILDNSWTGGSGRGSTGVHFCGRDTHNFTDNILNADAPVYIDLNPNSSVYQFDGYNFYGNWLDTLKSSNYAITFAAGVNPSNWVCESNTNAYQGKGGIYLNNQGTTTATSSMIRISHFRCESGTASGGDAGGYGIYMDFGSGNPACGNLVIENSSVNDPTCNGYYIKRVTSLNIKNVNLASTGTGFVLTLVNQAEIFSLGLSSAATVTFTSMYAQKLHKLSGAAVSDKSIGYAYYLYYASDTPANNLTYDNDVRKWSRKQVMANAATMALPALAAGESMEVKVFSGFGWATFWVTYTTVEKVANSTAWASTATVTTNGSGVTTLTNVSQGSQTFFAETRGA